MVKINYTNDTIADVLTRIRNAVSANKEEVVVPNVKMVLEILKVLSNNNYIESYSVEESGELVVKLRVNGGYRFSTLRRVSKPGVRRYISLNNIRPVKGGRGVLILSTSKGVVSGAEAQKLKVGGELLCEIW
jgi:small subunit ribosomal protein S8